MSSRWTTPSSGPSSRPTSRWATSSLAASIFGHVQENRLIDHKIMVPPNVAGRVKSVVKKGNYTLDDTVLVLEDPSNPANTLVTPTLSLLAGAQSSRPAKDKLPPTTPLLTGQTSAGLALSIRAGRDLCHTRSIRLRSARIDCSSHSYFTCTRDATQQAASLTHFSQVLACVVCDVDCVVRLTGKTVISQALSKHSNSQCIVYVGCGERGNEMAEVLADFPELTTKSINGRTLTTTTQRTAAYTCADRTPAVQLTSHSICMVVRLSTSTPMSNLNPT